MAFAFVKNFALFRSSSFSLTVVPSPASQVFYGSSHPFLPSVILSLIFDLNKFSQLFSFATRLFFLSVGKIAKSGRIPFLIHEKAKVLRSPGQFLEGRWRKNFGNHGEFSAPSSPSFCSLSPVGVHFFHPLMFNEGCISYTIS